MSERIRRELRAAPARIASWLAIALALGTPSCDDSSPERRGEPSTDWELEPDAGAPAEVSSSSDARSSADAGGEPVAPSAPVNAPAAPASTAAGATGCGTVEAPITEALERAYRVPELRALLVTPHHFRAQERVLNAYKAPFKEQVTEIELGFELGAFSFQASSSQQQAFCDRVSAPLRLEARAKDGSFGFTAMGTLLREEGATRALVYASAMPESVTGTLSAPGLVEVSLSLFPRQVRGVIHIAGRSFTLMPDACTDNELPLQPNEQVDLLGGRSVAELATEAEAKLQQIGTYDAVWQDGTNTTLRIELGHGAESAACGQDERALPGKEGSQPRPHITLRVPYAGRLSTGDGRLALPLDELFLAVSSADGALLSIKGRGTALASDYGEEPESARGFGDRLDAYVDFDMASQPVGADGTIKVGHMLGPTGWMTIDCLAWPVGGSWDRGDCRYRR